MIVRGSFDPTDGRPYIQGLLLIPSLRSLSRIDFLVDTGSDVTTLSPGDGTRMGVPYSRLQFSDSFLGAGESHKAASARAIVIFASEDGRLPAYRVGLSITQYWLEGEQLPSLIGTDILKRWRIYWDPPQDRLDFEVISADAVLPQGLLV